jgi:alpha-N-acetylglucosaminidase
VGSDPHFLLGPWLESAKAQGSTDAEKARAEYDARSILTTWGARENSDGGGVHDYADREWSGLISGFYAPRWRRYFAALDASLTSGGPAGPVDWFEVEDTWARQRNSYPTAPVGDSYALAARVRDALASAESPVRRSSRR